MKDIKTLKDRIPLKSLDFIEKELNKEVELYVKNLIGKNDNKSLTEDELKEFEIIKEDFINGFFYAIDFFNLYVKK